MTRLAPRPVRTARFARPVRFPALIAAAALLAVACGSGDDESSEEPELGSELAFDGGDDTTTTTAPSTTTTTTEPTTTTVPEVIAPLTGLGVAVTDAQLGRTALAVKIDNHPNARPQVGLSSADIVFDLRAEGVTRFMAVFHSDVPAEVGPVRSSRTSDFDLLRGLDRPLYASSGGNAYVMGQVPNLPIFPVTNHTRREYFRQGGRPAPHNLFIEPSTLYEIVGDDAVSEGDPAPWFEYRAEGEELLAGAVPWEAMSVDFTNSPTVGFTWDAERAGWLRTQDGAPHLDAATEEQLAPENVVIMVTTYGVSAADPNSPEVRSTGSGELVVLTDGHRIDGTWERADASSPPVLLSAAGEPIALTPGRTWVLYPESGQISG
ncbi:MAG: DUF3048 domain-containing protein [Actinomycetota bacterium]